MKKTVLSWIVALCLSVPLGASTAEERGDLAWRGRAAGFAETGTVADGPVRQAVTAYEEALEEDPENLRVLFKLMEALYFEGHFVAGEAGVKKEIYDREVKLADRALGLAVQGTEDEARAHFWAAISWGLWGMSHSRFAAGTRGVAAKIRDHAEALVALDERYADAGGLRLLGRLHTATPRIVFFTGWIDRREGITHLRRALEISRRDPRNLLFLAEALLLYEEDSRAEALELLRDVSRREPSPERLVEETETIVAARRRLAELEAGS